MLAAFLPLLLTIALAAAFFYVVFAADLKPRHVAVTPIDPHGRPRWNVQFTYLDDEGIAHEASQEFIRDAWKPGDEAIAEYDKDRPQEAVLIPVPLVAADADRARRERH